MATLASLLGAGRSESEWPGAYGKGTYEAPELTLPSKSGITVNLTAQDMWALGACLLKLLTSEHVAHDRAALELFTEPL